MIEPNDTAPVFEKPPVINCHTHIFTGDHVPPWLARTFLPGPFHYLLPLSAVVAFMRWWFRYPASFRFTTPYKKAERALYRTRMFLARHFFFSVARFIVGVIATINVLYFLYHLFVSVLGPPSYAKEIAKSVGLLKDRGIIIQEINNGFIQLFFIIFLLLFFESGRNLIIFILSKTWAIFGKLPGKQTIALLKRYVLIGRFSQYRNQHGIFGKLKTQYPPGTGLVVLPMDMAYMDAGPILPIARLQQQMRELAAIRKRHGNAIFPFVFADPRRIINNKLYFDYTLQPDGKVQLTVDCLVKRWIEHEGFSGIKIYPALGYFPFDENLLVLFKYAADHQLPVLTHCIRGPMFYRGRKKSAWDEHPVFMQSMGKGQSPLSANDENDAGNAPLSKMLLPQRKNEDFSNNFTHPLNFLCLLDETLLRRVIATTVTDNRIKEVFGYKDENTPLKYNLSHLKLCLAHFGGEDEWAKFLDRDRDNFSSQLEKHPERGIEFLYNNNGPDKELRPGKPEQVWKYADWYSIICSLMLQYPNVYADISFILHDNEAILPLLKKTLSNPLLRSKVLYGTDFYVVRNHKSDKEMMADMMAGLSEEEFDTIARFNPRRFLSSSFTKMD